MATRRWRYLFRSQDYDLPTRQEAVKVLATRIGLDIIERFGRPPTEVEETFEGMNNSFNNMIIVFDTMEAKDEH